MIQDIKKDAKARMEKSLEALRTDLSKLRTGRAHASLLDHVRVEYYGNEVPISQVASVVASDARTLTITPWEKTMVAAVEKAIMISDLGLNPATAGTTIRVSIPPLTEDRRRDLVKVVRQEGESTKVGIRNTRRDAIDDAKQMEKEKILSEDDVRRAQDEIQKITDDYVARVDQLLAEKEEELMKV